MLSVSGLPSSFLCYLSSAQYSSSHLSLPSPCNKSQPFYNPLGAVHNYPGSDCRSIYIRQCIGLASLMEVCVPSEWIFHDLTAWAPALLGLIDVRLSLSGLAWVCSIKRAFAKSGQSRAKQQVAHLLRREKAATPSLTVLLRVGSFLPTSDLKTWQRDVPRSLYAQFRLEKSRRALTCRASVTSWDGLMHEGRGVVRAATHLAAWGSLRVLVFYPQCKMYASRYQYPDKTF